MLSCVVNYKKIAFEKANDLGHSRRYSTGHTLTCDNLAYMASGMTLNCSQRLKWKLDIP